MPLDFRNTNSLWGSVIAETLHRCGVRHAVVSPGSRSAPLAFGFAGHDGIESVVVLDERSAGFFALGLAKRWRRPVALVCTSGTAAANFLPAIVEAHESGVPLIVLTADRPPELRACGAGQVVDQQKLYGDFVVHHHELAVPGPELSLFRYLRQTVAFSCARAVEPVPGPVHLNIPFRDPLPPIPDGSVEGLKDELDETFFSHLGDEVTAAAQSGPMRRAQPRGIIVAGPVAPPDEGRHAAAIAQTAALLGWPVLADALSPARHHPLPGAICVTSYDAILRNERVARHLMPSQVLCLGSWPTSKVLRGWLEHSRADIAIAGGFGANRDALHGRTHWLPLDAVGYSGSTRDPAWCGAWVEAEKAARSVLDRALEETTDLFEPKACAILAHHLPEETPIFVASSMPVRDAEYFWPATARRYRFYFNRGANGIDGTFSSALGIAHGGEPAVLLTGDLALLHDSNGFLLRSKFRGSLTVVLINNRGGGIFEHLPVAQFEPPFEEFFATPQNVDFAKLAAAHGVEHVLVGDWKRLTSLVSKLPASGIRILEVRTDRRKDAARRKQIFARAAEAVAAPSAKR